jgi:hypothetical protein
MLEHVIFEDVLKAWPSVAHHIVLKLHLTSDHQLLIRHVLDLEQIADLFKILLNL